DDRRVGTAPIDFPLFAKPGRLHELSVEGRDGSRASKTFEGEAGEAVEVELTFEGKTEAAMPASGLEGAEPSDTATEPTTSPPPESTRSKRNWVPAYILGGATVA